MTLADHNAQPVNSPDDLSRLYRERFSALDLEFKADAWKVLCDRVFQAFVDPESTVLDLGAGTCEFLNAIQCRHKIAVDLNPDVAAYAGDARVVIARSTEMTEVSSESVDVVFASNMLEHLPDKDAVLKTIKECYRILRVDGRLIVLGPNVRYLPGRYWDYWDHHTPLTHLSLAEAVVVAGFRPEKVVARFLPYTVKDGRVPRSTLALRAYLRLPLLWPLFGRQMLLVARRLP
jgi:SAM-dependent methyltransferase